MTDIYIRREEPSKRPIIIALVLIALIALGLGIYHLQGRTRALAEAEPDTVEPVVAAPVESATVTPAPAPRPAPPPPPPPPPPRKGEKPAPSPASTAAPLPGASLLSHARQYHSEGKLLEARETLLRLLDNGPAADRAAAETLAGQVNMELALSPREMPEKETYIVQSGDSLDRIARKYKTTVDFVRRSNSISGSLIHPGDRLRILTGDFAILVDKSDNSLVLLHNGKFFKQYRVGTGEYGRTPVGSFTVTDKIVHPPWWRPDGKQIPYGDPENLLGTHWLSLNERGYGIHGTWEPDTIGKQASAGCVRLLNEDIEELYTLVPVGTGVVIED